MNDVKWGETIKRAIRTKQANIGKAQAFINWINADFEHPYPPFISGEENADWELLSALEKAAIDFMESTGDEITALVRILERNENNAEA